MKIKLFENFNIDLNVVYELVNYNKFGEEIFLSIPDDEMNNTNPYDLKDMIKLYLKYKQKYPKLKIKKVISNIVDDETIEKIKLELTANKYNL